MSDTTTDIQIDEKIKHKIDEPGKYKVIFLNDDETPMDFVVNLLVTVFKHSTDSAEKITLTVHTDGSAVAGVYNYEIAEQKTHEAITMSRSSEFPLQIKMERE